MFDSPVCMSLQVNVVSRFTKEDGGRGRGMFDSPVCMSLQVNVVSRFTKEDGGGGGYV